MSSCDSGLPSTSFPKALAFERAEPDSIQPRGGAAPAVRLAPLGFALNVHALKVYGVIYYFVLFALEIVIWWIPYACTPRGA